jgi:hypothetical protein
MGHAGFKIVWVGVRREGVNHRAKRFGRDDKNKANHQTNKDSDQISYEASDHGGYFYQKFPNSSYQADS